MPPEDAALDVCIWPHQLCTVFHCLLVGYATTSVKASFCERIQKIGWICCDGNFISQIPVDQTIEQKVNRDNKTPSGIIGFSMNKSATQRWIFTAHDRTAITQSCRNKAGLAQQDNSPKKEASNPESDRMENVERGSYPIWWIRLIDFNHPQILLVSPQGLWN